MHNNTLLVSEMARNISDYINRVANRQERFILVDGGQPVAELRPLFSGLLLDRLEDVLRSLSKLSAAEATDFETDIEDARIELPRETKCF